MGVNWKPNIKTVKSSSKNLWDETNGCIKSCRSAYARSN